jgi:hypothetical protein
MGKTKAFQSHIPCVDGQLVKLDPFHVWVRADDTKSGVMEREIEDTATVRIDLRGSVYPLGNTPFSFFPLLFVPIPAIAVASIVTVSTAIARSTRGYIQEGALEKGHGVTTRGRGGAGCGAAAWGLWIDMSTTNEVLRICIGAGCGAAAWGLWIDMSTTNEVLRISIMMDNGSWGIIRDGR